MSDSETIRKNLVDAINELTRLLEVCEDPNVRFKLRIKIRELFHCLDRVVVAVLESGTPDFETALAELMELTQKAKDAKEELDEISEVIEKSAKAIKKVEKLIQGVMPALEIL